VPPVFLYLVLTNNASGALIFMVKKGGKYAQEGNHPSARGSSSGRGGW
jgi:hypothetical protein